MLLSALSWSVALRAQRLGVEVTPACPMVFQEFEVAYTADREIESIAPPRWGALTLVCELGRSHGSQLSIVNGVRTDSELFSYRYRVRSRVSGEVFVPGTTAVVGGRECRFERKRITVLPDSAHCEPQCGWNRTRRLWRPWAAVSSGWSAIANPTRPIRCWCWTIRRPAPRFRPLIPAGTGGKSVFTDTGSTWTPPENISLRRGCRSAENRSKPLLRRLAERRSRSRRY